MKVLVATFMLLLSACGLAIAAPVDDAAAIRKAMSEQALAWSRGNIKEFMQAYENSPETTFIGAEVRKGYEPILKRYEQAYTSAEQMGTLTFGDIEVRMLGSECGPAEYAVVTGRFHLARQVKGSATKDDGVFSLVWHRTPQGWKILLDHTA